MKLHHAAIWVDNLEKMKDYYVKYFDASSNDLYTNESTGFKSYFLSFDSEAKLEIMHRQNVPNNANDTVDRQHKGIIHLAFFVDTIQEVDSKAKQLQADGFSILRGPRKTGDGYYEFETLDPENNRLEVITKSENK